MVDEMHAAFQGVSDGGGTTFIPGQICCPLCIAFCADIYPWPGNRSMILLVVRGCSEEAAAERGVDESAVPS